MRSSSLSWLVVWASVLLTGCGPRQGEEAADRVTPGNANFGSRLDAAKAIGNTATRDEALSRVARDAAAGGDAETAKKAVEAVGNSAKKDEAGSEAALALGKAGRVAEANAVARLIGNSSARDQTLAKIAKGEFGR